MGRASTWGYTSGIEGLEISLPVLLEESDGDDPLPPDPDPEPELDPDEAGAELEPDDDDEEEEDGPEELLDAVAFPLLSPEATADSTLDRADVDADVDV